jgi:hypothetical protein
MIVNFPAERLQGKTLVFRPFLGSDYVVEVDGLRAGWILSGQKNGMPAWWWTMTGPSCGHGRIDNSGECKTLDEARDAFREAFEAWRAWALAEAGSVAWFGTAFTASESTFLPQHP